MKRVFDYMFYRIALFYRRKGNSVPETFASSAITVVQCFLVMDAFVVVRIFYEYPFPDGFNKYWLLPLGIVFMVINWYRYEKVDLYKELRLKWKDEDIAQSRRRGKLIVMGIVLVLLIPVLYGLIRHNIMDGKSFFH